MAPELPRDAVCFEVKDQDSAIDTTGGEEVALGTEAKTGGMAATEGTSE
jgi:hypothetical protein